MDEKFKNYKIENTIVSIRNDLIVNNLPSANNRTTRRTSSRVGSYGAHPIRWLTTIRLIASWLTNGLSARLYEAKLNRLQVQTTHLLPNNLLLPLQHA